MSNLQGFDGTGSSGKVGRTYNYCITPLGRRVVAAALRLREEIVILTLAALENNC